MRIVTADLEPVDLPDPDRPTIFDDVREVAKAHRYLLAILKDAAMSQPDLINPSQKQLLGVMLAGETLASAEAWREFNRQDVTRHAPL